MHNKYINIVKPFLVLIYFRDGAEFLRAGWGGWEVEEDGGRALEYNTFRFLRGRLSRRGAVHKTEINNIFNKMEFFHKNFYQLSLPG